MLIPGSVAETMAPKNRQSVKKKSPSRWSICFISVTQPYINNLKKKAPHKTEFLNPHIRYKAAARVYYCMLLGWSYPITKQEITVPRKA